MANKALAILGLVGLMVILLVLPLVILAADLPLSVVDTSTGDYIMGAGDNSRLMRSTFVAAGRYWVTELEQGSNDIVCASSLDGHTWDAVASVYDNTTGWRCMDQGFDGTYIHFITTDWNVHPQTLEYRRGLPNANGTITWSAAWQTLDAVGDEMDAVAICVGADGKPTIIFLWDQFSEGQQSYYLEIYRDEASDGTWESSDITDSMSLQGDAYMYLRIVPVGPSRYMVFYSNPYLQLMAVTYDYDAQWGTPVALYAEPQPDNDVNTGLLSVVEHNGTVDVMYALYVAVWNEEKEDYDNYRSLQVNTYANGSWSDNVAIATESFYHTNFLGGTDCSLSWVNGQLYAFWGSEATDENGVPTQGMIRYAKRTGATWGAPVNWLDVLNQGYVLDPTKIKTVVTNTGNDIGVAFVGYRLGEETISLLFAGLDYTYTPPAPPHRPASGIDVTPWVAFIVLMVLLAVPIGFMDKVKGKVSDTAGTVLTLVYIAFVLVAIMVILIPWMAR